MAKHVQGCQNRAEDPRLVSVGNTLYIFWTDGFKMYYGILDPETLQLTSQWIPKPPHVPDLVMDKKFDGREKNWSPFSRDGELWFIYSYSPFVCCRLSEGIIVETRRHECKPFWKWGFIKGGTPALQTTNGYITFFHSTLRGDCNYYHCGAFEFDENLEPTRISAYPIIAPCPDKDRLRNNTSYVVFPGGVIDTGDSYIISYGYNDRSNKIAAISYADLEYNLVPIIEIPEDPFACFC